MGLRNMMGEVQELLYRLGVTANYTGFFYTSYAVMLSIENMQRLLMVTKWLYPEIARHYHTTCAAVERNIRTVVAVAWAKNPDLLMQLARHQLTEKPTASQFIAFLSCSFSSADIQD